jgi:hypothetical protein
MDKIYQHLSELPRAQSPEGLFEKIEAHIGEAKVVALADWRQFAAAAVLVAAINVVAVVQYSQSQSATSQGMASVDSPIVSDYELYY